MKKRLLDKVVVITGASSGIGLATAQELAKRGCKVYNISRSGLAPEDVCKKNYQCDVNQVEEIDRILNEIFSIEGKIDVVVNNAGFGIAGAIENASVENVYKLIDTNLSSLICISGRAIKFLKKSGGGKIINISSVGGLIPLPYQATYSATKAGVEIFSRALANEVKQFGIKVCAILPGDTKTNFTQARVIENDNKDNSETASIIKSIKKVEKDEQTGKSPQSVAKVICKVIKKRNPPLRKTVGLSYKCVSLLAKLMPIRLINWIVRLLYVKK